MRLAAMATLLALVSCSTPETPGERAEEQAPPRWENECQTVSAEEASGVMHAHGELGWRLVSSQLVPEIRMVHVCFTKEATR